MGRAPTPSARTVWLLFAAALVLRWLELGSEPLWFDEAFAALLVSKPVPEILRLLRVEGNAPLYFLFLHGWARAFGDSEIALRTVSALAGAAAIPALYWTGRRLFSPRAGLLAALLGVASPLHVHYSQEARMYPMVALLGIAVLHAAGRLMAAPRAATALAFAAALGVGFYLHYWFFLLAPLAAAALLSDEPRRAAVLAAGSLTLVAVAFAPWVPTVLLQSQGSPVGWLDELWSHYSFAYAVPWSLECLGPAASYPPFSAFKLASSTAGRVLSLGLAIFVLAGTARALVRGRGPGERRAWLLTAAAVLTPLGLAFGISLFGRQIYMVARYDLIAWGPYHLLAGAVLAGLPRAPRLAVAALWLALSLATLWPHYTTRQRKLVPASMGDAIAERLLNEVRPGELVIFTAGTRTVADYYLRDRDVVFERVSHPLGTDDHLGWIDGRVASDEEFARLEASRLARGVLDARDPYPGVCVVAPRSQGTEALLREIEARGYRRERARTSDDLLCLVRP